MTTDLTRHTPIGRAAADHPELLPVFDRFTLDYCCHGQNTLEQACASAGADLSAVLAAASVVIAMRSASGTGPAAARSMSDLCDEIECTHHAFVREAFARLDVLIPRVVSAHGPAHPELSQLATVVDGLKAEMLDHMVREEGVLFPWLRQLENPLSVHVGPPWSIKRPIDCMVHDHDAVSVALDRIRTLTGGYTLPNDACGSYAAMVRLLNDLERDTHVHIHKENNILFPAGVQAESQRGTAAHSTATTGD